MMFFLREEGMLGFIYLWEMAGERGFEPLT